MWTAFVDQIRRLNPLAKIDVDQLHKLPWCKPDWDYPGSKDSHELLAQAANSPMSDFQHEVDEVILKSKAFPIKFPIHTVRLEQLKSRRPVEDLQRNIMSTYPLVHKKVLLLMADFLVYKREYGSSVERNLYKDMTLAELIDRLLQKRAISFLRSEDKYLLLSGQMGYGGWELVGTAEEKPPLVLTNCLSYDELKLSAMLYVSGYTECINDGTRKNRGVVNEENIEKSAVIIGVIGTRFARKHRMAYEDILITDQQNIEENGYGETSANTSRHMWRQLWAKFYGVPSYTYEKLTSKTSIRTRTTENQYLERFVKISDGYPPSEEDRFIFDNEVFYKRLVILAECILMEAQARGQTGGKKVFLNVIGCGLGVWMASLHQTDVYVLSFLERIKANMNKGLLNYITDVNFAYIDPSRDIKAVFSGTNGSGVKRKLLKCEKHPQGGINVQLENREPSSRLVGEHKGKLLVMTYPWDGNAHPGNEFWLGVLSGSGDPAAAASSQVAELHNAHVNPRLRAAHVRVAARNGLQTMADDLH